MDFILEQLVDPVKDKVGQFLSEKELWDKLHNIYSKRYLLITNPLHQNKEDTEIEQEELENDKEDYEEGEVDIEADLINSLSELKRERKKNKSLNGELIKLKESSQNLNKNSEEVQ
jgi:hypothetical protein